MSEDFLEDSPFIFDEVAEKSNVRLQDMVLTAIAMRKGVVIAYQFLPKEEAAEVLKERIKELTGVDESQMGVEDIEDAIQDN